MATANQQPELPTDSEQSEPVDYLSIGRPLAAFDVDGTITWADSFLLFLIYVSGLGGFVGRMLLLSPMMLLHQIGLISRHRIKTTVVRTFLSGMPEAHYQAACRDFAALLMPRILRPDALTAIRRHREQGHRVLLVSASLQGYIAALAEELSLESPIATAVEIDDGALTGNLEGPNVWGKEKLARLNKAAGGARVLAAYGDSRGDREMLRGASELGGKGVFRPFTDKPIEARRIWWELARLGPWQPKPPTVGSIADTPFQ